MLNFLVPIPPGKKRFVEFPSSRLEERFRDRYTHIEDLHPSSLRSRIVRGRLPDGTYEVVKFMIGSDDTVQSYHRFLEERDALVAIGAPYVPAVVFDGLNETHPFLILSNVPGLSLDRVGMPDDGRLGRAVAHRLKEPGELQRVYALFVEIFVHCHRCGYLHNDLNPGNLMLQLDRGRIVGVCLIDFGECLYLSPGAIYSTLAGTQRYFCRNKKYDNLLRAADDYESLYLVMTEIAQRLRVPNLTKLGTF